MSLTVSMVGLFITNISQAERPMDVPVNLFKNMDIFKEKKKHCQNLLKQCSFLFFFLFFFLKWQNWTQNCLDSPQVLVQRLSFHFSWSGKCIPGEHDPDKKNIVILLSPEKRKVSSFFFSNLWQAILNT